MLWRWVVKGKEGQCKGEWLAFPWRERRAKQGGNAPAVVEEVDGVLALEGLHVLEAQAREAEHALLPRQVLPRARAVGALSRGDQGGWGSVDVSFFVILFD